MNREGRLLLPEIVETTGTENAVLSTICYSAGLSYYCVTRPFPPAFILHPSALFRIFHPSSLILHPYSLLHSPRHGGKIVSRSAVREARVRAVPRDRVQR